MTELINIKNEEQIIDVIGKAIKEKKFDIAAYILRELNDELVKHQKKPYSIRDILFMNWLAFAPISSDEELKSVYFAEFEDGSVKVGISKSPDERIKNLSFAKGVELKRYCYTELIPNASALECSIHDDFKGKRIKGEYFKVNYDDLLMAVQDKYDLKISVSENIYKKYQV